MDNNKLNENKINNNKSNKNYNELEKELIEEKDKNKKLNEKIIILQKKLGDAKNMIKKLRDKINSTSIPQLEALLNSKDKQIERLKLLNPLYFKPDENIYSISFTSFDQKIQYYTIYCKNTDIFVRLEERLYEDYPEYKNKETYFIKNGVKIKRFKSLAENNIKNKDILMLYTYHIKYNIK